MDSVFAFLHHPTHVSLLHMQASQPYKIRDAPTSLKLLLHSTSADEGHVIIEKAMEST